jgi:hypothetical protein
VCEVKIHKKGVRFQVSGIERLINGCLFLASGRWLLAAGSGSAAFDRTKFGLRDKPALTARAVELLVAGYLLTPET